MFNNFPVTGVPYLFRRIRIHSRHDTHKLAVFVEVPTSWLFSYPRRISVFFISLVKIKYPTKGTRYWKIPPPPGGRGKISADIMWGTKCEQWKKKGENIKEKWRNRKERKNGKYQRWAHATFWGSATAIWRSHFCNFLNKCSSATAISQS